MTPDENGQTRRERNESFGEPSPPLVVPPPGVYLWEWYFDLSDALRRVRSGVCEPFPPTEYIAWLTATKNVVYPHEYDIMRAMDIAYCDELNKELADFRVRQAEQATKDAPKKSWFGGRKR